MLKRLALIFIVAAGLFALQPEVTPAPRRVATTEFVISARKQEVEVVFIEQVTKKSLPVLINPRTLPGFLSIQSRLISSQYFHSSLSVVA